MNHFTQRHIVDTMARWSDEDMADMHTAYGAANGNARGAGRLYHERFPNRYLRGHRTFANLHGWLREHGSLNENKRGSSRPRELRDTVEDVQQYFLTILMQALELQHVT